MSAGTIALTANGTAVTGTGTTFTTDLKAGDFIVATVGGTAYTLGVLSVTSNTALVLSQAYLGATASGLTWQAVPFATLNLITSALAQQVSYAVKGFNLDKNNWQQVFSGTGNVTVNLPDGSSYTGPAWSSITDSLSGKAGLVSGAVPVSQGGTGGKTAADARTGLGATATGDAIFTSADAADARTGLGATATGDAIFTSADAPAARVTLGLGTAALLNDSEATGSVLKRGQGMTNTDRSGDAAVIGYLARVGFGSYRFNAVQPGNIQRYSTGIYGNVGDTHMFMQAHYQTGVVDVFAGMGLVETGITFVRNRLYGTANTTTNSTGALVPASPVIRIVNNRDTCTREDILGVDNTEYAWSTVRGLTNAEAKGVTISRTGTGTYLVKGALGLAKDLWHVMDPGNGQGRIIAQAEAEETNDGIEVRCYKLKYALTDDGEIIQSRGALTDIPDNTWIDVRLEMQQANEIEEKDTE